jgi:hypothetical protein
VVHRHCSRVDAAANALSSPLKGTACLPSRLQLRDTADMRGVSWIRASIAVAMAALVAACGSPYFAPTAPSLPLPPGLSLVLTRLYERLPGFLVTESLGHEATLPLNPRIAHLIQAQINLLREPGLAERILEQRLDVEHHAVSIDGGSIAIGALFPRESMRADALATIHAVADILPVLETFLDTPYPDIVGCIQVWYGFTTGTSGSHSNIVIADRNLDLTVGLSDPLRLTPEAAIAHELGHAYYPSESLTQFLEMYAVNAPRFGLDARNWPHARRYVPLDPANVDGAAVLDIYTLLGHDRMRAAMRRIEPVNPPYGEALPAAVRQAFIDEAPDELKDAVANKASQVRM